MFLEDYAKALKIIIRIYLYDNDDEVSLECYHVFIALMISSI